MKQDFWVTTRSGVCLTVNTLKASQVWSTCNVMHSSKKGVTIIKPSRDQAINTTIVYEAPMMRENAIQMFGMFTNTMPQ